MKHRRTENIDMAAAERKTCSESTTEQDQLFYSLFGSWEGDETGEELAQLIYSSRVSSTRDVEI